MKPMRVLNALYVELTSFVKKETHVLRQISLLNINPQKVR